MWGGGVGTNGKRRRRVEEVVGGGQGATSPISLRFSDVISFDL